MYNSKYAYVAGFQKYYRFKIAQMKLTCKMFQFSISAEYKIKIKDEFRKDAIDVLTNINWFDELHCIAMLKIQQFHIINVLKKYVPNIN